MSYVDEDSWDRPPIPTVRRVVQPAPNPVGNEESLVQLADRLEDESAKFVELCEELARADAEYHRQFNLAMIDLALNIRPAERRKAMAMNKAHEEYIQYRLLQERQRGMQQYLRAIHEKIGVHRTVAVNWRGQG